MLYTCLVKTADFGINRVGFLCLLLGNRETDAGRGEEAEST